MCFVVLALLIGGSSSWAQQSSPAAAGATPVATSVTATGCLSQEPTLPGSPIESHESAGATGLALKKATVQASDSSSGGGGQPPSAVPGSSPSGRGSGTISRNPTPSESTTATSDDRGFWIGGKQRGELSRYVGKRVQVTGVLERTSPSSSVVGDRAVAGPGNRQQSSNSRTAHPSAPVDTIDVQTFRVVEGSCS
jgi:hypothetical protein